MRIISVQLKNIKSHRDSDIAFSPGINVLSGPNGVGKSTVFEAIGYALFGVDARDFVSNVERFLSIGAKRGEVAVTFVAGTGETFRVTRTVGTPSTWRLAVEKGGDFEIEDHANGEETEARIRQLLGLSAGRSLADQFKLVIGPFQNDFLGPFVLKQQTKRKEAFDEILGIDSWRKTFDGTKELGSAIKGMIGALEAGISAREERVACLSQRREELVSLNAEEEGRRKELQETTAGLASMADLLGKLDERKMGIESLKNEAASIEQSIVSGAEYLATQKTLVELAEAAALAVEAARPGKERFDAAEKMLVDLRERDKARQAVEKELAQLESRLVSAAQAADHEEKEAAQQERMQLDLAAALRRQEDELGRLSLELMRKEKDQQDAIDLQREIHDQFRELPLLQGRSLLPCLKLILGRLAEIDRAVCEKKGLLAAEGEWQGRAALLEGLRRESEELHGEKARLVGLSAGLGEGEEKLQEGVCPFFQEPCPNLEGKGSPEVFSLKRRDLELRIAMLRDAGAALESRVAEAQSAVREMERFRLLRNEIENLERERLDRDKERLDLIARLDPALAVHSLLAWGEKHLLEWCGQEAGKLNAVDFSGSSAEQLAALDRWERQSGEVAEAIAALLARALADAEGQLATTRTERGRVAVRLQELERRKVELAAAEEQALERRKRAAGHREAAARAEREKQERAGLMHAYAEVGLAIVEWEGVRSRTRPDQERFLQAEPTARELQKRNDTLAKYARRLAELERDKVAKQEKLAGLVAGYSADDHSACRQRKESLQAREATLRERLNSLAQSRARIAAEIAELEKVLEEIGKKQQEVRELRKKEELVRFLRTRVFKNVSAQLSERFREEISLRADTIYRTVAESDEELRWGENYQIVLRDMADGAIRERSDDQLSGGQVMSAVVALRLALLQTIGARIAFFDEPTSNLDASRRENLARAFRTIDHGAQALTDHWYDQLFLISHDVSFTEITDQIIDLS